MKSTLVLTQWAAQTTTHLLRELQKIGLRSEEEECCSILEWKALVRRLFATCDLISITPMNIGMHGIQR